jgi:hypothetical protein
MSTITHRHRVVPYPLLRLRSRRLVVSVATLAVILAIAVLRQGWAAFGAG